MPARRVRGSYAVRSAGKVLLKVGKRRAVVGVVDHALGQEPVDVVEMLQAAEHLGVHLRVALGGKSIDDLSQVDG